MRLLNKLQSFKMDSRIYASLRDLIALRQSVRGFSFLPKQPVASLLSGRQRSRLRGRGLDFEELRHYRMGDDVRNIDWRVTNRTGKPHVRVYSEERDRPVIVVVDQRLSMFFGSVNKMKSVVACEFAALSLWNVLKNGDRVGAIVFNDTQIKDFRPSRSQQKNMEFLSQLIQMNHALSIDSSALSGSKLSSSNQLQLALQKVERLVGHDYLVIILSDFSGWSPEVLSSIKRIRQHNDLIAALIADPLEEDLSSTAHFVISDGNYQVEVPASSDKFRKTYSESFQTSVAGIRSMLKKNDIPLLTLNNVDSCSLQLQQQLGGL